MGLDMYLYARKYVSGYDFKMPGNDKEKFDDIVMAAGLSTLQAEDTPSGSVEVVTAYWRKANHIHNWFVREVQNGVDDCGRYYVELEKLKELQSTCRWISESKDKKLAAKKLPTKEGFFFGGTDYDEYYFESTAWTAERLAEVIAIAEAQHGVDFYYSSSW